jgi:hypothetical protein
MPLTTQFVYLPSDCQLPSSDCHDMSYIFDFHEFLWKKKALQQSYWTQEILCKALIVSPNKFVLF